MPGVVEGRPFLVEDVARVATRTRTNGWADDVDLGGATPEPGERAGLVAHFTTWSLAEHASIASFARFALQILGLGAPSRLVARATAAMEDEIRHARFGFGLVQAIAGEPTGPATLAIGGSLDGDCTLEGVLRLTVREGMIGETLAALEVRASADLASLPFMRANLASIADDESRHAELAYAFAAWAVEQDPALAAIVEEEVRAWQPERCPVLEGLARWGILDRAARDVVRREGFEAVVLPLVQQLTARARDERDADMPADERRAWACPRAPITP
jgi:hypothetical protein